MKKVENPLVLMEKRTTRIFRGGNWFSIARGCRAAHHPGGEASRLSDILGFRPILRSLKIKPQEKE
jgi:hypothetical protein